MAARSFSITIQNWTGRQWQRSDVRLLHGEWSQQGQLQPPDTINKLHLNDEGDARPGVVFFESESDGFATGTEGTVNYTTAEGTVILHWNNPFVGGNEFTARGPDQFAYFWGDPGGNDASIVLDIRRR